MRMVPREVIAMPLLALALNSASSVVHDTSALAAPTGTLEDLTDADPNALQVPLFQHKAKTPPPSPQLAKQAKEGIPPPAQEQQGKAQQKDVASKDAPVKEDTTVQRNEADSSDANKQQGNANDSNSNNGRGASSGGGDRNLEAAIEPEKTEGNQDSSSSQPVSTKAIDTPVGKLKAYVISLPDQKDRRDKFIQAWKRVWPELEIEVVTGIKEEKRGLGLGKAFINALEKAMSDGIDYGLFLEDDADPFDSAQWPNHLLHLLQNAPPDTGMLLLGGHHVAIAEGQEDPQQVAKREKPGLIQIKRAFGSYAWAIPRKNLLTLRDLWFDHINDSGKDAYNIDMAWWKMWESNPCYIATPLLVDHLPGFSNTWGRERNESSDNWMGHREWWNYPAEN